MARCLVVGGRSPIGAALVRHLRGLGHDVQWTSRRREDDFAIALDLETLVGLDGLPAVDFTVLVAAETRFSICEKEPDRTFRTNVEAPSAIAERLLTGGGRVMFLSTIAVHDGHTNAPSEHLVPMPNSAYGSQKLEAEQRLLALGGDIVVLRLSKVITPQFALFADWLDALHAGRAIAPFSDMLVAPLWLGDMVKAAARLLTAFDDTGVFHLSARDEVTYAEMAARLAERVGAEADLVRPVRAAEVFHGAWLPVSARLGCDRLVALMGLDPPAAMRAVDAYLAALRR